MADTDSSSGDDEMMTPEDVKCLFCEEVLAGAEECFAHCRSHHNFDMEEFKDRHKLDFYGHIRLLNWIRKEKPRPDEVMNCPKTAWEDDKYLAPTDENDPLLWNDVFANDSPKTINEDAEEINVSLEYLNKLKSTIQELNLKIEHLERKYDGVVRLLEETQDNPRDKPESNTSDEYFWSYSDCQIHREMIKDDVRTSSYRSAIISNSELFKGKAVLDVGCGTGILSLFAAQAGADKVIAVEFANIIQTAKRIAENNGFGQKIQFIQSKMEEATLPVPQVDVIISEWMGYGLLFEGMLDSVIDARDKFLKPGGLILPNQASLHMCCVSNMERFYNLVSCWSDVYGFKMTELQFDCKEALVEDVDPTTVCSDITSLLFLNLNECSKEQTVFKTDFSLRILENRTVTAFCLYFDINFELPNPVSFSTAPTSKKTHWHQCVLWLREPFKALKGEIVSGQVSFTRQKKNSRDYQIFLSFNDQNLLYSLK